MPAFPGAAAGAAASQFARQVITGSDVARPPLSPFAASLTPQTVPMAPQPQKMSRQMIPGEEYCSGGPPREPAEIGTSRPLNCKGRYELMSAVVATRHASQVTPMVVWRCAAMGFPVLC